MSEKNTNTIQLPGVDFNEIARQVVSAKILEGIAHAPEFIDAVVANTLAVKVTSSGELDRYNTQNAPTRLQWMAQKEIEAVTLEALKRHVADIRPTIEAEVIKMLKKQAPSIAAALLSAWHKNIESNSWLTKVELKVEPYRRD